MDPLDIRPIVDIIDTDPGHDQAEQADFQLVWTGAYNQAQQAMSRIWARLREEWLRSFKSEATRRAYRLATDQWLDYLSTQLTPHGEIVQPWMVDAAHVRGWIEDMECRGLAPASINQKLAACSSWYTFVINEKRMVEGVERCAFFDAQGNPRSNPFHARNVQRPEAKPFRAARPLSTETIGRMLDSLNQKTISGVRNHALLLTAFLTGWRVNELITMQWGRIRPHRSVPGDYVYEWTGKGGKSATDALPAPAYHAVIAYLRKAGRLPMAISIDPGQDCEWIRGHEYIWQPLNDRATANLSQFRGDSKALAPGRHISPQTANRILRSALRRAGVEKPERYRFHDLRHSLAHAHYQQFRDVKAVQRLLHHSSSAVTDRYLQELSDPIDRHGKVLYQQLSLHQVGT